MALLDFNISDIGSLFTSAREAITGQRIVDPLEIAKIDLQLEQMQNALVNGQLEINKAEAQSPHWFVASWRPAVGWVGALSLALMFIPKALVLTGAWVYSVYIIYHPVYIEGVLQVLPMLPQFPDLGVGDVIALLGSMLGIGFMRSYDKIKGVDTKRTSK